MNIHPIKTEDDYETALAEIEHLWGADEGTEQGDTLDILLVLVENYENKHHPIYPPDPVEAIKFRMEQMNISSGELDNIIGSNGYISEVLNRRQALSLNMIRSLHLHLQIPLESLVINQLGIKS